MKKRYKVKNINKTKLKSYLKTKINTKNERDTRHTTSNSSK
jgi:hypothetical protein